MSILNSISLLIEIVSSLVIFGYCATGVLIFIRQRNRIQAQIMVANGTLLGLNIKLVAALLKTIELQTWNQLALFATILVLRTIIKKVFQKQKLLSN
jgi:uncharacterized membrane protein